MNIHSFIHIGYIHNIRTYIHTYVAYTQTHTHTDTLPLALPVRLHITVVTISTTSITKKLCMSPEYCICVSSDYKK